MKRFVKGDIVVTPFPFSDLKSLVKRPALVIADLKGDDLILCQITSKNRPDPYQVELEAEDLSETKLKIKSFIKPSILFTIRSSVILYKMGRLKRSRVKAVEEAICKIIKSN